MKLALQLLAATALVGATPAAAASWTIVDLEGADAVTPAQLAAALLSTGGAGVAITSESYVGAPRAAGAFVTTDPGILGFTEGVLLTSGCASNVVGPNDEGDATCGNGTPGDASLGALISGSSYDAAVLEFDFVPDSDVISFEYVFASEEYDEFANSAFNDVFAFFINGQNYALVPGTTTPVSINNVNDGNPWGDPTPHHASFYRRNVAYDVELDGLTTLLSVEAPVLRGVTNHIKLAIADVGDDVLDSAVFIRAGSFVAKPADLDKDGVPDTAPPGPDNCVQVANPGQEDADGDGVGDACDTGPIDADGDGVEDASDNCPAAPNADQLDQDGDGQGDACDPDVDGDGVADDADNCLGLANPDQANADGDAQGDACDACPGDPLDDGDHDGVCGDLDVCPADPDPDQKDFDGDRQGDVCDPDDDGDGSADDVDNCPLAANSDQADWDENRIGDACDWDDDGDGHLDDADRCPYSDPGAVVDADGCTVADLCPCEHSLLAPMWKNHGAYVSCVAKTATSFVEQLLLTEEEKGGLVSAAAGSICGRKQ